MPVEITVNWHFIGQDSDTLLSYHVGGPTPREDEEDEVTDDFGSFAGVLPLTTSVLSPGVARHVAAV